MKQFIYFLWTMVAVCAMSSCCKESHYIIPREVKLKNVTLECVNEVDGVKDPTSGLEYTQHSFLCTGSLSGSTGNYHIEISDPLWGRCGDSGKLIVGGNKIDFAFTFTNRGAHADSDYFNYIIKVVDEHDNVLIENTIMASKHPENTSTEVADVS